MSRRGSGRENEGRPAESLAGLCAAYRTRFGEEPPILFMSEDQAIEVLRHALRSNQPAPPEAWPEPGCNCA